MRVSVSNVKATFNYETDFEGEIDEGIVHRLIARGQSLENAVMEAVIESILENNVFTHETPDVEIEDHGEISITI